MPPDLTEAIKALPSAVELPPGWEETWYDCGDQMYAMQDHRTFPRHKLRHVAALQQAQSLPGLPRAAKTWQVLTKDVSRRGVAFLHGEQLFPGEQMQILFPSGSKALISVARCQRHAVRCYEVGARFVQNAAASPRVAGR